MYDFRYPMMDSYNEGWSIFMMLLWAVILVIIVVVVFRLLKNQQTEIKHNVTAVDIAKRRYANGEINKIQFNQLIQDLK